MGFLKKDSDFTSGEHYSIVSAECYFQGTLSMQGSLRIDGKLEGAVDNARHVIISDSGRVKGDISAEIVVCSGEIEGNICADMLEILAKAVIKGDIRAKKMIMEDGAQIEGLCRVGESVSCKTDAKASKSAASTAKEDATK